MEYDVYSRDESMVKVTWRFPVWLMDILRSVAKAKGISTNDLVRMTLIEIFGVGK